MNIREQFIIDTCKLIGVPYIWGGKDLAVSPGLDCSGFVENRLHSLSMDMKDPSNAQAHYDYWLTRGDVINIKSILLDLGDLVFYGSGLREISHIAIALSPFAVIEAGGGDSTTTTVEAARLRKAQIRISPMDHRHDIIAVIRPRGYPWRPSTMMSSTDPSNQGLPQGNNQG